MRHFKFFKQCDFIWSYYLKVYQVIIHVSNCPGSSAKPKRQLLMKTSLPLHPRPLHKRGCCQTWMASQIVVLSVLGQDFPGPFFPLSSQGSRFTVSINQGSYLKSLLFSLRKLLHNEMICDSAPFDFHFQSVLKVLVIGQIKVVRSCQLKRDLPLADAWAFVVQKHLRKTWERNFALLKLHLCRRSKCISFFWWKTYNFLQRNSTKQFGSF